MTNTERIQAHNELLRECIETAEGLPDAGTGGREPIIEPLHITENREYTAPEGIDGYSPVTVAVTPILAPLTVTPTKEQQAFIPNMSDGFDSVVVNPIPEDYIQPSGTLDAYENGHYNVTEYAELIVDVPIPDEYIVPTGTKTITKNGTHDISEYASVNVDVPQTGGECNHEVYDLSVRTSPDVRLKPKIEKPTAAQIDKFVNNSIALIADDVEVLDGILALHYQVLPITDDIALPVVWFRTEMKDFRSYYVWQEDIEIAKMALSAMGSDVSGVTGEGWQLETETGFRTLSVEELQQYDFYREDYYMIPYGDYYYSLFDISLYNKEPADIVAVRDGYVLETQDTLCEKDIYISQNPSRTVWVSSQDGMSVGEGLTEYDELMYIDLEIVGDCPDHCVSVEGYAYNAGGDRRTSFYSTLGNEYRKQKLTVTSGYGIHLEAFAGFEFGEIYTNATILEQSETEVYISGLRHNTHITVVAKDAGGGSVAEPVIEPLEITENGTYTAPEGVDGYSPVTVNVQTGGGGEINIGTCSVKVTVPASANYYFAYEKVSGGNVTYQIDRNYLNSDATSTKTVRCDSIMYIQASNIKGAEISGGGELVRLLSGYGAVCKTPSEAGTTIQITLTQ